MNSGTRAAGVALLLAAALLAGGCAVVGYAPEQFADGKYAAHRLVLEGSPGVLFEAVYWDGESAVAYDNLLRYRPHPQHGWKHPSLSTRGVMTDGLEFILDDPVQAFEKGGSAFAFLDVFDGHNNMLGEQEDSDDDIILASLEECIPPPLIVNLAGADLPTLEIPIDQQFRGRGRQLVDARVSREDGGGSVVQAAVEEPRFPGEIGEESIGQENLLDLGGALGSVRITELSVDGSVFASPIGVNFVMPATPQDLVPRVRAVIDSRQPGLAEAALWLADLLEEAAAQGRTASIDMAIDDQFYFSSPPIYTGAEYVDLLRAFGEECGVDSQILGPRSESAGDVIDRVDRDRLS